MRSNNILLLIISLTIFIACTKTETGPPGLSGQNGSDESDTGSISGHIVLYDEFTRTEAKSDSVLIMIASGSFTKQTLTDNAGNYAFTGIPTGTYNISCSKPDYGTMKKFGVTHISGSGLPTQIEEMYVVHLPVKTEVRSVAVSRDNYFSRYYIDANLFITTTAFMVYDMEIYLSKSAQTNDTSFLFFTDKVYGEKNNGADRYRSQIDFTTLSKYFSPGDSVYVAVYKVGKNFVSSTSNDSYVLPNSKSFYIDPATARTIYPFKSPQPMITSFIYE